jgi:hypothetical protein
MLSRLLRVAFVAIAACLVITVPNVASASTITNYGDATDVATFVPGQSLATPAGGPWNSISFNFFLDVAATTPTAAGTLFLLSQEYLGTPDTLAAATSGYIAQSTHIASGHYVFDPTVTLQPGTQYFFYANIALQLSGNVFGAYTGGILYAAADVSSPFDDLFGTQDAAFILSGSPVGSAAVPEPASLLLCSAGGAALLRTASRRKRSWS